jgi:fibronectin-binding autotransporter adhesin
VAAKAHGRESCPQQSASPTSFGPILESACCGQLSIDGIGSGDPLVTGYSDYASLGQYTATITGVLPSGFTWVPTTSGTKTWNTAANWSPAIIPSAVAANVRINNNIAGNQTIQLATATSLGSLTLGDSDSTHNFTLSSTGGSLVFNNTTDPASLSKSTGGNDVISAPVSIVGELDIVQSASGTLSFSGIISGSGSLKNTGTGVVVVSAANTYTGVTTLEDGVLRLDNSNGLPGGIDNTVGAGESSLVINGGILGLASGNFTRALGSGAGQLSWSNGSGGFAAFGADREVRLNNGTTTLSWASNIIGSGKTLILSHSSATHTIDFKNGISLAGAERTVQVEDGDATVDAILSGVLSDSAAGSAFKKTGNGLLSLTNANTYGGSTTVSDGVLLLSNAAALPIGNLKLNGGGVLGLASGDLNLARAVGTAANEVQWTGSGGFAAYGANRIVSFSGSSINWNASNFIGNNRSLVLGHETSDATLLWQQILSLAGASRTVQVEDGSANIDAKMVVVSGGSSGTANIFSKTGAGTLAFIGQNTYFGKTIINAGTLMIGDGGTTGGISQNSPEIFVEVGATLAANRSNTLSQSTNPLITIISGEGGFSQIGTGTTVLNLANTYSGPTAINSGILQLGNGGAAGSLNTASAITIASGATFAVNQNDTVTQGTDFSGTAITGAGGFTQSGTGTTILSLSNTYTGPTTVSGGILHITGTGRLGGGNYPGNLSIASGAAFQFSSTATQTLSGIICGNGSFNKESGSGNITLTGSNTRTGATTINGTLILGNINALSTTSAISLANAARLQSTVAGTIINAPITLGAAGTNVEIDAPAVDPGDQSPVILHLNGPIIGAGNVTFTSSVSSNTINTVLLNAPCSYTGSTLIHKIGSSTATQTIVKLGVNNALPVTTVVTIDGGDGAGTGRGTEINLNGYNQQLAGLTNVIRPNVTNNIRRQRIVNSDVAPHATLTINNSTDSTFTGNLGGTGFSVGAIPTPGSTNGNNFSLTKSGTAKFTLGVSTGAGGISYIGDTTVNQGILSLERINTTNETSTVTIAATGATLDLNFTGTDTVDKLFIGTTQQPAGIYGAVGSASPVIGIPQITGTGTLTVTALPPGYATWALANAGGQDGGLDYDNDGVTNAIEYILGGGSATKDIAKLPTASVTAANFIFTFIRDQGSIDGLTTVEVQTGPSPATWTAIYPVPATAVSNSPGVTVVKNSPSAGKDTVTLVIPRIPASQFARLKVTP